MMDTVVEPNTAKMPGKNEEKEECVVETIEQADENQSKSPSRILLTAKDLDKMSADKFLEIWQEQERYINSLEERCQQLSVTKSELDLKVQTLQDSRKRDQILVMKLNQKEQDISDLSTQLNTVKSAQASNANGLRSSLVDPAVNALIQKLSLDLEETKKKMQETQEELSAWKFTPDSATGKRLMSKCRQLLQENEDIGKMIASGKLARLESELAMQKALCEEMKKNQEEMDDFVQELDLDVEGMQSTIFFLQQQLKEAKDTIAIYEAGDKPVSTLKKEEADDTKFKFKGSEEEKHPVVDESNGNEISQFVKKGREETRDEDDEGIPQTRREKGRQSAQLKPKITRGQKRDATLQENPDDATSSKNPGRSKRRRVATKNDNENNDCENDS